MPAGERILDYRSSKLEFDATDVTLDLGYQFSDETLAYMTFSTGYKSGGFDQRFVGPTPDGAPSSSRPESVDSLELGLKTSSSDGRLRLPRSLVEDVIANANRDFVLDLFEEITGALPGGVNRHLRPEDRDALLAETDQIVAWAEAAVGLVRRILDQHPDYHRKFGRIDSNMLSLVGPDGTFELYQGRLRARAADGRTLLDQIDCRDYDQHLREAVKPWSYMKFPFITSLGEEDGWYRVGPLARINNCDFISTPLAEAERKEFMAIGNGLPIQSTMAYHWTRLIELLHCTEAIAELLCDSDIVGKDLRSKGKLQSQGTGVIEAPRGTLFHHYEIDDDGIVNKANLIVSTTNNNQAMNESIRQVANHYLDGKQLTEPLLNQIEVAIRAYDPCLSCATHALGKMPLEVQLLNSEGDLLDRLLKRADGVIGIPEDRVNSG